MPRLMKTIIRKRRNIFSTKIQMKTHDQIQQSINKRHKIRLDRWGAHSIVEKSINID